MSRRRITFDMVREVGCALPGVEAGTTYGSPALKLRGKLLACLAIHRSAEPESLVVSVGFDERDDLIAAEPDVYYLTDHYADHPVVLVRLGRVHRDALPDLLRMAWRFVSTKKRARL